MSGVRILLLLSICILLPSQEPTFESETTRLKQLKDWVGLQALAKERLKAMPKDSSAWVLLGMSYGKLERQDEARSCFQNAIEIDKNDAAAWFNLGLVQLGQRDIEGLTSSLSKLSELNDYLRIKLLVHPGVDELLFKDFLPRSLSMSNVKITHQPELPPYPSDLKRNRIQADMLIEIFVGADGVPMKAERLWGPKGFENCVTSFALLWRFEPYIQNGKATPFRLRLRMPFRVQGGRPFQPIPEEFQPNKAPNT
jgi:tetratricopeptide (TPR) repeat protein